MANGRRHGNRDTQFGPERLRARPETLFRAPLTAPHPLPTAHSGYHPGGWEGVRGGERPRNSPDGEFRVRLSERAPLIWTRAPADFIRARSHRAADQTPYTWPRPTNRRNPIEPLPRGSRPYMVRATMASAISTFSAVRRGSRSDRPLPAASIDPVDRSTGRTGHSCPCAALGCSARSCPRGCPTDAAAHPCAGSPGPGCARRARHRTGRPPRCPSAAERHPGSARAENRSTRLRGRICGHGRVLPSLLAITPKGTDRGVGHRALLRCRRSLNNLRLQRSAVATD